jgi:flagella basal body P-ring formation protein FlgA
MWRHLFMLLVIFMPRAASADSLVATRTIRAQSVIEADDVTLVAAEIPNALALAADAVGLEARVAIYAGRPILHQILALRRWLNATKQSNWFSSPVLLPF